MNALNTNVGRAQCILTFALFQIKKLYGIVDILFHSVWQSSLGIAGWNSAFIFKVSLIYCGHFSIIVFISLETPGHEIYF